jgi:GR25 family glycosyltransferase involved in LPS biosynthesis
LIIELYNPNLASNQNRNKPQKKIIASAAPETSCQQHRFGALTKQSNTGKLRRITPP